MFQSFNVDSPSAHATTVVTLYDPSPCIRAHAEMLAEIYADERGETVVVTAFDGLALVCEVVADPANTCKSCGELSHVPGDVSTYCTYAAEDYRRADALADLIFGL